MITRTAKLMLLAGIALFYTLVVLNNLTDFNSNYQFVRHVLMMDSTFPGQSWNVAGAAIARVSHGLLHLHHCCGRPRP